MNTLEEATAPAGARVVAPSDWLPLFIGVFSVFVGLPFLAPVFMQAGWEAPGRAIYFIYSFLCHQMAQRSLFLFGPRGLQMYNLADLPIAREALAGNPVLATRQFIGSPDIGWKVAWSDRMTYMYGAVLLVAIVYAFARRPGRVRPLPVWAFALLLLPMALDGGTHTLSDWLGGLGGSFRYTNVWLADLTGRALPEWFYVGDAFGSFNSWMRLLSGVSFGIGVGGLLFPWIDLTMLPRSARPADDIR